MLTLIVGTDAKLVESEIKKQVKKYNQSNVKVIKNNPNLSEIYFLTLQTNLFLDPDVYVIYNDDIFNSLDNFKINEETLELMNNSDTNIIIASNTKISLAAKIVNFTKKINVIEIKEINNKNKLNYINLAIEQNNIQIPDHCLDMLETKLSNNAQIIENEINKLKYYNYIDEDTINYLVSDYQQSNVFDLVQLALKKESQKLFELYEMVIKNNYDSVAIVQIISLQLTNLYLFLLYKKADYKYQDICKYLNLTYYTYQINESLARLISLEKLTKHIDYLYELDLKLKQNLIDKDNVLRYFLLKLIH